MTTWILKQMELKLSATKQVNSFKLQSFVSRAKIALLVMTLLLIVVYQLDQKLFEIIVSTLGAAYLGVSVFVALTLGIFYALDHYFRKDVKGFVNNSGKLQVPIASVLGALPGCGGAIIVVTQFVNGHMSFGGLVAVLISTMGDAAFLLLAKKPEIALLIYAVSMVSGIVFGCLVNLVHGKDFLRPQFSDQTTRTEDLLRLSPIAIKIFIALLVPGVVFGLLQAFQVDANCLFGIFAASEPVKWLGCIGAIICIAIWCGQPMDSWSARFSEKTQSPYLQETVVAETSFVSVWMITGFLIYELFMHFSGINVVALFHDLGGLVVLSAILIGFIPGCGPQILVTTLYINGVVPLSAQFANAISNDGDALFPAIALAKKAAIVATIYSAAPAFLIGYGVYAFIE